MVDRFLDWEGCTNARDLGGLRTLDGRLTRRGSLVRSDSPAKLTPAGWAALEEYGIRTILTLCTDGMVEEKLNVTPPLPGLALARVAIEDVTDPEFVRQWASTDLWCTPLYYADALRRWPERHAAVIAAIAQAPPGGVLFHCVRGNDRTGIITLLLLALAGVTPEEIIADYALSPDPDREAVLAREQRSLRNVLCGVLEGLDVAAYLRSGGASAEDLAAVRARLFD